jgi:hypothetical protein
MASLATLVREARVGVIPIPSAEMALAPFLNEPADPLAFEATPAFVVLGFFMTDTLRLAVLGAETPCPCDACTLAREPS